MKKVLFAITVLVASAGIAAASPGQMESLQPDGATTAPPWALTVSTYDEDKVVPGGVLIEDKMATYLGDPQLSNGIAGDELKSVGWTGYDGSSGQQMMDGATGLYNIATNLSIVGQTGEPQQFLLERHAALTAGSDFMGFYMETRA